MVSRAGEENKIACAIGHHVVDVHQQVILLWRLHELSPYQRFVAHDVKGTAKTVMGIVLEVGFRHLMMDDCQCLLVIDILSRLSFFINEEADAQFLSCRKDSLQSSFQMVGINVINQRDDTGDVVLHHLGEFQAVVKDA